MRDENSVNPYAAPVLEGDAEAPPLGPHPFPHRRMYFWRVDRLKAELRRQPLSDREALPYLLAYLTFETIASSLPFDQYNHWDALGSIWTVAVTVLGTLFLYRQNGGSAGRHFLQRFFAIGWVVTLRCAGPILVGVIAMLMVLEWVGGSTDDTNVFDFVFLAVVEVVIYWRIGHHIGDLGARTAGDRDTAAAV